VKALIAIVFLILGIGIGVWLALGPKAPDGVAQSWQQVKAQGQQLLANAQVKINEAETEGAQGIPGPGLLDRILIPFKGFGDAVGRFWVDMSRSIRPRTP
jgi:hypothetical protein